MPGMFGGKIDEQLPIWRQVAALLINPAMKPGAVVERVVARVPLDDLNPSRRTAPQDDGNMGVAGENDKQAAGRCCGHTSRTGTGNRDGSVSILPWTSGAVNATAWFFRMTIRYNPPVGLIGTIAEDIP